MIFLACDPCVVENHSHDFDMTWVSWLFIIGPFVFIALLVYCIWFARHQENKIIEGPHPEDAYIQIGNIKLRKSSARMAVSGYVLTHSVLPHLGDGAREAMAPIPQNDLHHPIGGSQ